MTRGRAGFTLIEVMLALALIGLLASAMMSFLWSLSDRQAWLGRAVAQAQATDALFDRLEGDLLGAIAGDARLGGGFQGGAARLRLLSRGVDLADGGAGDLQESVYHFLGESLSLSRRPLGVSGDDAAAEPYPLLSRLSRVRFRYFDGRTWKLDFDSAAAGRFPAAIEVCVWRAGRAPAVEGASGDGSEAAWPEPDRSRVIVVPDGPEAAWGGSSGGGAE